MLFPDLANKIVREVRRLITENIIIINIEGVIIANRYRKNWPIS